MEHPTATTVFQTSDWSIFDSVLSGRNIPRQVMIYPERYMDQFNVTRRRGAIKEMGKRGLTLDQLEALTPFCRRYLREVIANGNEPELALGLPEADITAGDPLETEHPLGPIPTTQRAS